jgi:signal transduction histidine kinase
MGEAKQLRARLASTIEALRKSDERCAAGQLALEVMHELKNPLEALGHLTFLALGAADDPEKVRSYMRLAGEQMGIVRQIANNPLEFARPSQTSKPTEMVLLAESALRIHQRAIEAKRIHLVKDLPRGIVAEVHGGEMLQVVSNLIVNALDALHEGGVLCLRLSKRAGKVYLTIADNGSGIPPEHSKAVFQPYFTTKKEKGTGLGLALSKKIVDRHRGTIRMRSSVRPGRSGTAFKISLPI